jgi:glycerol uptake facilitator-like aquaporin
MTVDPAVEFHSLQYSLFITCFVEVIGGFFFLFTALYITWDRRQAEKAIAGKSAVKQSQLACSIMCPGSETAEEMHW